MPVPARLQLCARALSGPMGSTVPAARRAPARRAGRPPARNTVRAAWRALPQVNAVMEREETRAAASRHGRLLVTALVRERLSALRRQIRSGKLDAETAQAEGAGLLAWVETEVRARTDSTIRPVINATGVILHTNLGRAVLPEAATRRMVEVARAYTTLEYDLARGARGSRSSHLDRCFGLLFPGQGFHIVNKNAAAVLLALNTLAEGKEVIVSRGELVEIGGSFRIPDVMRKSGAILREVGTTNKTRLQDYERAIGPKTGLILKVHPSNYRIVGFTAQATLEEVASLGRRRKIPVLLDQGSGNLIDLTRHGIRNEPSGFDVLAGGADVVCLSGDRMLGGPRPGEGLPTSLLIVSARGKSARALESALRRNETPVIARIEDGKVLLDLRTVLVEQDKELTGALLSVI